MNFLTASEANPKNLYDLSVLCVSLLKMFVIFFGINGS